MSQMEDGNYSGSGKDYNGKINVKVKIENDTITAVNVLTQQKDAPIGKEVLPVLKKRIIKKQTYNIDGVSGATITSNGIKEAVKNALNKASNK